MGQKVNPVGFRLGVNRGWDSVWYAKKKDFGNYLIEDFKIREYIKKNVINSGVSKVMIERTANKCYVTIYTSRPGFVIGKKGSDIDKIKNNLSKFTSNEVTLNIKEVKNTIIQNDGYVTIIKKSEDFEFTEKLFTIDDTKLMISKKIKESFDPRGLFNPGKMYKDF